MINISFIINGKVVEPDSMRDVLDITFMKHIRESIQNSLAGICCPNHGKEPSIIVKGQNLDTLSYEVSGCCNELISKASNLLK